ncbi:MAG: RNA methyltransferase [Nitrospiraceae bacterium]|nr:RNA methyltransferase [Nitrospiraceae bacterium]
MNYAKISSAVNQKIKEIIDIKNKRGKYKGNAFILDGPHLIEMALASGTKISRVLITEKFASKKEGRAVLTLLKNKAEIFEVEERIIAKIADTETPQGILAVASYPSVRLSDIKFKSDPFLIIIDNIQEPGNLGAIIRTADAAGADAVIILKGTCDIFMQKTLRATAGSIFNIQVVSSSTDEVIKWLKANNITLISTAADAQLSIFDADIKKASAFVFGNEAHGISAEIQKNADLVLSIPIMGKAESLNVAVCAAICLYEAVRQKTR